MRGSTPIALQVLAMHRRTAGSQRPLGSIRALKLDTHGTSTEPEEEGSPRSRPVRREEAGDGNLEPWMGSCEPRRRAAALACALFTLRRDRSCLSIRAAGRPHGCSHTATSASLVKNHCASFSSKRSRCAGSLRVKTTAHPLRGSTRPQAFSLASEPAAWPSGHASCGLGRCRRPPSFGDAVQDHVGKLVGEVHPTAREAPTLGRAALNREGQRDQTG